MFQDNFLTTSFSVPFAGGRGGQLKTRWDKSEHERERERERANFDERIPRMS